MENETATKDPTANQLVTTNQHLDHIATSLHQILKLLEKELPKRKPGVRRKRST